MSFRSGLSGLPLDIITQLIGDNPESGVSKKRVISWPIVASQEPSAARGVEVSRAGPRCQLSAVRQHALPQRAEQAAGAYCSGEEEESGWRSGETMSPW